jgi:hypothetical protein
VVFFLGVAVEPGDRAQPARDGGPCPAGEFHVAAEGLDVDPLGLEQVQAAPGAPGRVLAQVQGVGVAGQPAVAGQEPAQGLSLIRGEQRIGDREQYAGRLFGCRGRHATTSRVRPRPGSLGSAPQQSTIDHPNLSPRSVRWEQFSPTRAPARSGPARPGTPCAQR